VEADDGRWHRHLVETLSGKDGQVIFGHDFGHELMPSDANQQQDHA